MINKEGQLISLSQYTMVHDFNNAYARVERNNLWGFIDVSGNEIISARYEEVTDFEGGLALVKTNGKWEYIDVGGKEFFRD